MSDDRESKSLLRALIGTVSLVASLVVIPLGMVVLVADTAGDGGLRALVRPLGVLSAGGALLSFGIAMLIWELSVRYDVRR